MQDMHNLPNNVVDGDGDAVGQDGNPATGAKGTKVLSVWANDLLKNILYVIQQAGTGITDGDRTDLYDAILAIESTAFLVEHLAGGGHSDITADTAIVNQSVAGIDGFNVQVLADTFARTVIKAASSGGTILFSDGINTWDINIRKSGVKTLQIGDNAAGNLTEIDLKTLLLTLAGDIDMAAGKYVSMPDVSGGGANSGKFFGGNGGFMWFDGVTTGTTAVILDSTLDWRDRWICPIGYNVADATPSNFIPGGSSDNILFGWLRQAASNAAEIQSFGGGVFYSEQGSTGSTPYGVPIWRTANDQVVMYADSSDDGKLKIKKVADTGNEYAFGLLVIFSDDQGHY